MESIAIVFYEKPGCLTNRRQKQLLEEAGYSLEVRNLLTAPWTGEQLVTYLAGSPVASWFNPSAPAIKQGEINPEAMDETAALAALVATPLLIRRPLLEIRGLVDVQGVQVVQGHRLAGFDRAALQRAGVFLPEDNALALPDSCSKPSKTQVSLSLV